MKFTQKINNRKLIVPMDMKIIHPEAGLQIKGALRKPNSQAMRAARALTGFMMFGIPGLLFGI